jgi:hypothetical protein
MTRRETGKLDHDVWRKAGAIGGSEKTSGFRSVFARIATGSSCSLAFGGVVPKNAKKKNSLPNPNRKAKLPLAINLKDLKGRSKA